VLLLSCFQRKNKDDKRSKTNEQLSSDDVDSSSSSDETTGIIDLLVSLLRFFKQKNCVLLTSLFGCFTERPSECSLNDKCGLEHSFPCKECGYQFTKKGNLRRHLLNVHKVNLSQLPEFREGNCVNKSLTCTR